MMYSGYAVLNIEKKKRMQFSWQECPALTKNHANDISLFGWGNVKKDRLDT